MGQILINGMSMPKSNLPYGVHIIIRPNGDVVDYLNGAVFAKAAQLSPHGDLADKKVIYDKMVENIKIANKEDYGSEKAKEAVTMAFKAVLYELDREIPTVVEAEDGKN